MRIGFLSCGVSRLVACLGSVECLRIDDREVVRRPGPRQSRLLRGVEVKVCAHSPNFSKKTHIKFPDITPDNMEVRYYEFIELRDLYQSADLVVISLLENFYSAGLTVLMEAVACRKPVIITNNIGTGREFIEKGLAIGVRPGDVEDLKRKIEEVMRDNTLASNYAEKAHDYFKYHHTTNIYIDLLSARLSQLPGEYP